MTNITVYDTTAEIIEGICDKYDLTTAEFLEEFIDEYFTEWLEENGERERE